MGSGGRSDSWNILNNWSPATAPNTLSNNAAYQDAMNFLYGDAQGTFRMTNQNGVMTWWTDLGQESQGMIGTYNMLKRKSQDPTLPYSSWQQEMQIGIQWFGDHFGAEGTAAVKYGSYFSVLLKNGFGAAIGGYNEKRYTLSYKAAPRITSTKRFDAAISKGLGGGYSYDDENKTNQVYVGVLTFGIEVSRNNIFVGWNPNLNLGIGIGGELGFKAGLSFETDGWFNYNNW